MEILASPVNRRERAEPQLIEVRPSSPHPNWGVGLRSCPSMWIALDLSSD